jgi:hypothetical protein
VVLGGGGECGSCWDRHLIFDLVFGCYGMMSWRILPVA